MRKRFGILIPFLVLFAVVGVYLLAVPQHVSAAINQQINFQGKLTNPDGTNVTDGTYSITFTIYSGGTSAGGGTSVWTETQSSVAVSSGIFQVALGSVNNTLSSSVNFNSTPLFLGVKVGTDAEMTPLIQFTAAPYAFDADQVGGLTASSLVQLGQNATAQTDASTTNSSVAINKTGTTAKILDLQRGGASVLTVNNDGSLLAKNQTNSATGFVVQGTSNVLLTANTTASQIVIGSATTDTVQVLLQLDSFSTYADTATCGTTTNQGAMYYNTATNTMRACINGNWEDLVSTGGLGLLAFGVVPDSSNAGAVGDIAGVSNFSNSPCKVVWTATQQVTVEPCTVYSGGRRLVIPTTALSTSGLAANTFSNVCISTAAGAATTTGLPVLLTGSTTETSAVVPTFVANNPVECFATVKTSGTAGNVGFIWDTRTFTTTDKEFTSVSAANSNGMLAQGTTTMGTTTVSAAAAQPLRGVIVATAGTGSSTTVNAIIATGGLAFVKFASGATATINNSVQTYTTTAGYGTSVASTGAVSAYAYGGPLLSTISTSCTTTNTIASACQYSPLVDFNPSR